jgi:hypothetical protein
MTLDPFILAAIAWFLLSGGKPPAAGGKPPKRDSGADGAALLARANGARALALTTLFLDSGESAVMAEALARWAGVESGGNPLAVSRLGERGLLQAMPEVGDGGIFTHAEWRALGDPATPMAEHVRLAVK